MVFSLMKKLVVALTKLAVNTTVPEPGTTVLACLIDFAAAQGNAAQTVLDRIEGKIDDIHQNPFRLGTRILLDAGKVKDTQLRMQRIQRALDAFTQAAELTYPNDPLLPLKARLSVGACYDLLLEREVALMLYEEVFRAVKDLEKLAQQGPENTEYWDLFDRIDHWFESKEPDYKARQQLIGILTRNEAELNDFSEHLLTLILKRTGTSREKYLEPWNPPKQQTRPLIGRLLGGQVKLPAQWRPPANRVKLAPGQVSFLVCPNCGKKKIYGTCPVCRGAKLIGGVTCKRCLGLGNAFVCDCDKPVVKPVASGQIRYDINACPACKGTGKFTFNNGKTWVKCLSCNGTGKRKKFGI
ncbi:MAG TPA: hypothetical protein VLA72_00180 [Anaerolineales bacterium]|nr:hypothetical protein [Anaerolineales bacterium]